jgi:hypothetical protein
MSTVPLRRRVRVGFPVKVIRTGGAGVPAV